MVGEAHLFDNFQEGKHIFEIDYEPNLHFPNVEYQNELEEDRVFNEIGKFLMNHVTKRVPVKLQIPIIKDNQASCSTRVTLYQHLMFRL